MPVINKENMGAGCWLLFLNRSVLLARFSDSNKRMPFIVVAFCHHNIITSPISLPMTQRVLKTSGTNQKQTVDWQETSTLGRKAQRSLTTALFYLFYAMISPGSKEF